MIGTAVIYNISPGPTAGLFGTRYPTSVPSSSKFRAIASSGAHRSHRKDHLDSQYGALCYHSEINITNIPFYVDLWDSSECFSKQAVSIILSVLQFARHILSRLKMSYLKTWLTLNL